MSRLSIEITTEQHQHLKALAALNGKTIKEYVLNQILPPLPLVATITPEDALRQLEAFLEPRIRAAKNREITHQSVTQIFDEVSNEVE